MACDRHRIGLVRLRSCPIPLCLLPHFAHPQASRPTSASALCRTARPITHPGTHRNSHPSSMFQYPLAVFQLRIRQAGLASSDRAVALVMMRSPHQQLWLSSASPKSLAVRVLWSSVSRYSVAHTLPLSPFPRPVPPGEHAPSSRPCDLRGPSHASPCARAAAWSSSLRAAPAWRRFGTPVRG